MVYESGKRAANPFAHVAFTFFAARVVGEVAEQIMQHELHTSLPPAPPTYSLIEKLVR